MMFPNLTHITINTAGLYSFNLLWFLENISTSLKWTEIIIKDYAKESRQEFNNYGGWISNLWMRSSIEIQQQYKMKHLTIEFHKEPPELTAYDSYLREYLLIKRMD